MKVGTKAGTKAGTKDGSAWTNDVKKKGKRRFNTVLQD
jgi:hypothetical protein